MALVVVVKSGVSYHRIVPKSFTNDHFKKDKRSLSRSKRDKSKHSWLWTKERQNDEGVKQSWNLELEGALMVISFNSLFTDEENKLRKVE